jgi:hypothetical protein
MKISAFCRSNSSAWRLATSKHASRVILSFDRPLGGGVLS